MTNTARHYDTLDKTVDLPNVKSEVMQLLESEEKRVQGELAV